MARLQRGRMSGGVESAAMASYGTAVVTKRDEASVAAETARPRMLSLDVFRGLCVAGMLLVTDPGTYSAVYPQLLHAAWRGATAADMIFPGFLFAVGVAVPIAVGSRLRRCEPGRCIAAAITRRAVLLIVIGLVLNAFPEFAPRTLRIPGVLQRIGLCYAAVALLWLGLARVAVRRRMFALGAIALGVLVGYGALLLYGPVPGYGAGHLDTLRNLPAYVDREVFTVPHLWPYGTTPGVGVTFDPEGLLSTLGAIASTLAGVVVGELLRERTRLSGKLPGRERGGLAAGGMVMIAAGLLLDPVMPIIKKIWTPSFALLSSGVVLLCFLFCYWAIDVRGLRRGLLPLKIFGTNAIAAFALGGIVTSTLQVLRVSGVPWHTWGYTHLFLPWLPAVNASLAYAVVVVAMDCLLIGLLYRRGIFLRV